MFFFLFLFLLKSWHLRSYILAALDIDLPSSICCLLIYLFSDLAGLFREVSAPTPNVKLWCLHQRAHPWALPQSSLMTGCLNRDVFNCVSHWSLLVYLPLLLSCIVLGSANRLGVAILLLTVPWGINCLIQLISIPSSGLGFRPVFVVCSYHRRALSCPLPWFSLLI